MKYFELESAYEYSNFDGSYEHFAFISKKTGEILYGDEDGEIDEEQLEEYFESDDFIQLPDKRDLDLGTQLVWKFVRKEIPGLEPKVRAIFSRRGAYARFKGFLEYNELLDSWYTFESEMKKAALLEWCAENGIEVESD
ncbi:UPF0158 family protein [Pelagicoccus mobilis]|uniref:Uncharacterized protein n=1 Tax=Pelagicoccus mobilis TaxID=415221 RepID=A0A934RYM3_9BACT|nr:UPF0158 family protein [Pelagicoccus mobilis]MBK1877261.1 hypothetical protein [Pelagicoccus mobilis]